MTNLSTFVNELSVVDHKLSFSAFFFFSYGKSRVQKMTIRGEILEQPSVCMKNLYPTFAATVFFLIAFDFSLMSTCYQLNTQVYIKSELLIFSDSFQRAYLVSLLLTKRVREVHGTSLSTLCDPEEPQIEFIRREEGVH
ncbi:hypothetical protein KFU94_24720 [Chloroflexi bacterium TSY]|nr:hypothetical protein [Chloroflexi bacterium TSY]